MNSKKILTFFLVIVLLIPGNIWAGDMDQVLTKLIPSVKERIDVPKELAEFNYSMRTDEKAGENIYDLNWSDKDGKIGNVQITAESSGNIINYSKNMYNNKYSILAKVSYEEGLQKAKDFLKKIKAPYADAVRLENENARMQGNQYNYVFNEYHKGIKVLDRKVNIFVDKETGEVTNFSGLKTYKGNYEEDAAKISLEKAKEAYINKIGVTLAYNLYYDYLKKTVSSFPVYSINNLESKAIDAKTGEVMIPLREEYILYGAGASAKAESTAMDSKNSGLTPQELKVTEEIKGLITKEEAKAATAKFFPRVQNAVITNASLYKSEYDNKYIWTIAMQQNQTEKVKEQTSADKVIMPPVNMNEISVSVDAKTGEVLSYYYSQNEPNQKEPAAEDKVKEKVQTFLTKIAKDKYSLTQYDTSEKQGEVIPLSIENPYRSYNYVRMVKGIPVKGNGLSVTYNASLDEVTGYTNTWNNISFKDLSGVISKDKIADQIGLELMYVSKDDKNKVLAYTHEDRAMTFDPFIGVKVNSYDGKPVNVQQQEIYDDIKGHQKEGIIKKLYDSGIYLPGKSFQPNSVINQYDFMRLVLKVSDANVSEKEVYDMAVNAGIIGEYEKNKNQLLTRENAVKYLMNSTPYKSVAKLTDIYEYPFKDEKKVNKELKGYITLAYGLKIIEKDKSGRFNPKAMLTRADAAEMIYNMLLLDGK